MNTGKQKPGKRYPLVNWADGMPVNKKHFIQLEDHFTDRLCEYQSFQLNRANYGLLPFRKGEAVSGDFSITELGHGHSGSPFETLPRPYRRRLPDRL